METTTIEIPSEMLSEAGLGPADVLPELAAALIRSKRLSADQAARYTGNSSLIREPMETGGDMNAFISWAAHDLKSPMNAVIGFTKVVVKGIDGPVNELQTADLNTVYENAQKMLATVNSLIDMARLNTGELRLELQEGSLAQAVDEAVQQWKSSHPSYILQAQVNFDTHLNAYDPVRFRQIITGLLTHISLQISNGNITLQAFEAGRSFVFELTGAGEKSSQKHEMELAMLEYISRGLVRLNDGELELNGSSPEGISVKMTLPVK